MNYEEWWEDFVAEHEEWKYADSAALRRAAFQAGAASRDAEVAKLKDDNEYLYVAAIERDQLRAELATALAACKAKDEAILQENYSLALSFQPDTSALEAIVKKAGEVMREKCAKEAERDACPAYEYVSDCVPAKGIAEAIRALPAVTLEDLK